MFSIRKSMVQKSCKLAKAGREAKNSENYSASHQRAIAWACPLVVYNWDNVLIQHSAFIISLSSFFSSKSSALAVVITTIIIISFWQELFALQCATYHTIPSIAAGKSLIFHSVQRHSVTIVAKSYECYNGRTQLHHAYIFIYSYI